MGACVFVCVLFVCVCARDNVQVEGVELIRCVNGCVTSLGTGPA